MDERLPADIVVDTLRVLVECLRAGDLERVRNPFSDDAVLFGSEASETAQGTVGLRAFSTKIFAQPRTYARTWERPLATRHNGILWFVASTSVELYGDEGEGIGLVRMQQIWAKSACSPPCPELVSCECSSRPLMQSG